MKTIPIEKLPEELRKVILHLIRKCVAVGRFNEGIGQEAAEEAVIELINEGRVRIIFEQGLFYFEVLFSDDMEWTRL